MILRAGPCPDCRTIVEMEGEKSDRIMQFVRRYGVQCPLCKRVLEPKEVERV